jgi:hypothetical protein
MIILSRDQTQYLQFSEALKDIPGRKLEHHRHPAVVLDRATGPGTHLWGWWTCGRPARPCLLWWTGGGWGATVVEPEADGADGYERTSWLHRLTLLDRALARALGPCPTLHELELQVPSAVFGRGRDGCDVSMGLLWGIRLLRAAHSTERDAESGSVRPVPRAAGVEGAVDEELARHALIPTLAKAAPTHPRLVVATRAGSGSGSSSRSAPNP